MRKIRLFIAIICLCAGANGWCALQWNLWGDMCWVDTLYHATVGLGIKETHLNIWNESYKAKVFVAEVNLEHEYNDLRVLTAGDTIFGLTGIPTLAQSHDSNNITQIAGINADFGKMGNYKAPAAGYVVSDGEIIGPGGGYADDFSSYFYKDNNGVAFARNVELSSRLEYPSGKQVYVSLNKNRDTDELVLYNRHRGKTTGTNEWGAECALKIVEGKSDLADGNPLVLQVISAIDKAGNMKIPDNGFVLSCHGAAIPAIEQLKIGDKITLTSKLYIDYNAVSRMPEQLVGGCPIMLRNGIVDEVRVDDADKHLNHLNNKEPRTAIGVSEDSSIVFFVVVDGRNPGVSDGIKAKNLAVLMRNLGCYNAMNCDGGGSSQFYVKGLTGEKGCKVRNFPVGGTYCRPVSNGIFAVSKAPVDTEVASIEIVDKSLNLNEGDEYIPVVYAFNKYGVLINTNLQGYAVITAPEAGRLSGNILTVGSGKYNTTLTVSYNGLSYTIPMYINGGGEYVSEVEEVNVTNAYVIPEYFTIQGFKIDKPQQGHVMIVRRGSRVTKEIYSGE